MKATQMPAGPASVWNARPTATGKPISQYAETVMNIGMRVSFRPRSAPFAVACTQSATWNSAA